MINYRSCQNKSSFRINYDFHSCPSPIIIVVETLLDRAPTSRRGFPGLLKSGSLFCFLVEIFGYLFLGSSSDSFHLWGCLRFLQLETSCSLEKVVRSGNRISVEPWTQHQQQQQHHHHQEQYLQHQQQQQQQLVLMDNNTTARSPIITGGALKTSAPVAAVLDSGSVSYVSSKEPLPYDPMLGWYTAATLSGLLFLFLACVGLEKLKDKVVAFFEKQSPVSATGKLFDDDVTDVVKPLQRKSTGGENKCLESDALLGAAGSGGGGGGGAIDYRNCSSADNYVYLTLDRPNCLRLTHDEFSSQPCDMQTEFSRADDEIMTNRISEESEENVQMLLQQQQQQQGHQLQHHHHQQQPQQQQFQLQQHPQPQSVKIEIVEVHTETPSYGDSPASYGELSPAVMNDAMNESTV